MSTKAPAWGWLFRVHTAGQAFRPERNNPVGVDLDPEPHCFLPPVQKPGLYTGAKPGSTTVPQL